MQSGWWDGDYPVTQGYGCTDFAGEGYSPAHPECPYFHEGIDLGIPCGVGIKAPLGGYVVWVGFSGYGPHAIQLRVGNWDIFLGHLQASYVTPGQQVVPGSVIGEVGSEGFSTGCHLHFEVRPAGGAYRTSVDPTPWLSAAGGAPFPDAPPPSSSPYPRSPWEQFVGQRPGDPGWDPMRVQAVTFVGLPAVPLNVHSGPGREWAITYVITEEGAVSFDGWVSWGIAIADNWTGDLDDRWFHIPGKGWVTSAYVNGNP